MPFIRSIPPSWVYLAIRFLTLGIRFLFFALFFHYSEAVYGAYSLVATTVTLGVYFLGLDFYYYANREMLKPGRSVSHVFLHQLLFYLPVYLVFLPLFYLFFHAGFLDRSYLWLFYAVLIVEHLSYELFRLLFILKKPLLANINLFFRNGFGFALALGHLYFYGHIDIKSILIYWLSGDLLSVLISVSGIPFSLKSWKKTLGKPDFSWIKKGLAVSMPFFLATISYKIIEFSDRYMIDWFLDKKSLGVYAFFSNIALLVNTVVYTAVISLLFPGLVESLLSGRKEEFRNKFRVFKQKIFRWSGLTAVGVILSMPALLLLLHKQEHLHKFYVFVLLVLGNWILNLSYTYHYILYGKNKDWIIFRSTALAALINIVLNLLLIPVTGLAGAALATLLAFVIIYIIKKRKALQYLRKRET